MIVSTDFLRFCREHQHVDIYQLALKAIQYPDVDMPRALQQIKGLQIAKYKIPSWHRYEKIVYPPHLSLEQCSSEQTANYKQQVCGKGGVMIDLTGGMGVDTFFLSKSFQQTIYIEQQAHLVELAKYNFEVLGQSITTIHVDATDYLKKCNKVDFIYIDPARRNTTGGKTVFIEDCTPNLLEIQELLDEKADRVMIKLSPMLDITLALNKLNGISDIHIISVDNECKELLFIKKRNFTGKEPSMHCINITSAAMSQFSFTKSEEECAQNNIATEIELYLYEPNTSIMKAGAYKSVCEQYGLSKLHISSHLYTSNTLLQSFAGRTFKVLAITSLNKKDVKNHLSQIDQANIATRNFPMKPDELRKKLKLKDGGNTYIFGTTLVDNNKVLVICERIS